jgi:hypothetical protein
MKLMTRIAAFLTGLAVAGAASGALTMLPAQAQDLSSPPPVILPPAPPPPPPPPRIEVPRVPQMDEIPPPPRAALPRRSSFKQRISRCIDEGAAMGLGPNERAAYSRACANQ